MELNLKQYTIKFSVVILSLFSLHYLIFRAAPNFIGISSNILLEIYVFLAFLNFIYFLGIRWLFIKWAKYAGLLFTALSMVKMAIAILFLSPYMFPKTEITVPTVLNFMAVYFCTLTFEVVFIAKNMTKV